MKNLSIKKILVLLLSFSFMLRAINISYPKAFVFDEVYYTYTANEYVQNNRSAWDYSAKAPEGKSYAWVNPPFPQEIIALSIKVFGNVSWAWRLPSAVLGTLSIYFVFLITKKLFDKKVAILAAFLFSIDGLNFVGARTAMLDIYLVTFILASLLFSLQKKYFLSAVLLGFAIASKWTGIYLLPLLLIILVKQKDYFKVFHYLIVPPIIYLLTYSPFFIYGYTIYDFKLLLKEQIYYHANLRATHTYASAFWSWPLNLYPVWYFVEYKGSKVANIFASGNPILFWLGSISIFVSFTNSILKRNFNLLIVTLGFLLFFLPWAVSPRIMFLYYFSPAVPFLCMALAFYILKLWEHEKTKILAYLTVSLIVISFILIYPFLVGIALPKDILDLFFNLNLTKNPFKS